MSVFANQSLLVTGGAGFIGSHFVDRLVGERPRNLVVVDNLFLGRRENLASATKRMPNLKLYVEDASNYDVMRQILKVERPDMVFDFATVPLPASLERPRWSSRVIYDLALTLCELARQGLTGTLIHISTSEVYGTAHYTPMDESHPMAVETPYAAAKASADLLVRAYHRTFGIDAVIVRPFNTYGPRQNAGDFAGVIPRVLARMFAGQRPIIFGDGNQARDYTYVSDVVDGILAASSTPDLRGETVNLGSGQSLTIHDLVDLLRDILEFEEPPQFGPPRPADVRMHVANVSRLQQKTGFRPKVPLREGIRWTVQWYKDHWDGAGATSPLQTTLENRARPSEAHTES